MERKVITELSGGNAPELFELLSHAGFRRSHSIAYRPACSGCQACVPVRIPVAEFDANRTQRRIARRNRDLVARIRDNVPTQEQFELFVRYLEARHADGEMVGMGPQDYSSMVADSPVDTRMIELRDPDGQAGGVLPDRLEQGRHLRRLQLLRNRAAGSQPGSLCGAMADRRSQAPRVCRSSILAIGSRTAGRWRISPASARWKDMVRRAGGAWSDAAPHVRVRGLLQPHMPC